MISFFDLTSTHRLSRPIAGHSLVARLRFLPACFVGIWCVALQGAEPATRSFDIPAAAAEVALKRFADQSGLQVLYPTSVTRNLRTNAVKGEFTPREALDRILAGTGLAAVHDERSGALTVRRQATAENGGTRPRPNSSAPAETSGGSTPTMRTSIATRLASVLALATADPLPAQTAASSTPSARDLARYDRNKNGTLDADERAAMEADELNRVRSIVPAAASPGDGQVVAMSPFEVKEENRGYYGMNSMSGTRLNSKIEDLASSITVVTKEQMADFAMLDINDVFNYESNTEGTGNYSDFSVVGANQHYRDGVQDTPNTANRIRGIDAATVAFGGFETSGRVPVDPINIDAVEISRGPNANIFGIGNGSGTVNMQPASARLNRNSTQVSTRVDSHGGYRGSIDLNRVLKQGVLAFRTSAVTQHDGFVRRPSGMDSNRLNAMVTVQPLRRTTFRASWSRFDQAGNRPNYQPPRDTISWWRQNGSPTWDPIAQQMKVDGRVVASSPALGRVPGVNVVDIGSVFVDQGGIKYWTVNRISNDATPIGRTPFTTAATQFMQTLAEPTNTNQPLFAGTPMVTDKSIYDWSRFNTQAPNTIDNITDTWNLQLEHVVWQSARQTVAAQFAWMREDSERDERKTIGMPSGGTASGAFHVDVNERLLDGTPNPYFLRPYINQFFPQTLVRTPLVRDNYRGQLAYEIDLRREKSRLRWLGLHRLVGYGEYKRSVQLSAAWNSGIESIHPWLPFGVIQQQTSIPNGSQQFRYYIGDNQGQNMDYAPSGYTAGIHPFTWRNAVTGQWINEPTRLGQVAAPGASVTGSRSVLKAHGAILQSFLLQDRLVTTFGWRQDETYDMSRGTQPRLPDGQSHNWALQHFWPNPWTRNEGPTRTAGVVLKPFPGNWLSFHANKSDGFTPAAAARDVNGKVLSNPESKGEDYGFTLQLFAGKLVVKANRYETLVVGKRFSVFQTIMNIEPFNRDIAYSLGTQAEAWVRAAATARGVTLSQAEFDAQVRQAMGVEEEWYSLFKDYRRNGANVTPFAVHDTNDLLAKGHEIEINYNPSNHWTTKLNLTEQQTFNQGLQGILWAYVEKRLPFWEGVVDPRTGEKWFTKPYSLDGVTFTSAQAQIATLLSQLRLGRALEGKANPQVRRYRVNLSTNYRLAGLTDHRHLKRMNVGGSIRWEDKGAIGFYGVQQLPAQVTDYDPNRPIWSKGNTYVDLFIGYRTRLFKDKVGATFQLNGRNLQESGRLQAVSTFPNGRAHMLRIIDPRQFIFTATFDL